MMQSVQSACDVGGLFRPTCVEMDALNGVSRYWVAGSESSGDLDAKIKLCEIRMQSRIDKLTAKLEYLQATVEDTTSSRLEDITSSRLEDTASPRQFARSALLPFHSIKYQRGEKRNYRDGLQAATGKKIRPSTAPTVASSPTLSAVLIRPTKAPSSVYRHQSTIQRLLLGL